jgi:serine/threonine-protein kinase
VPAEVVAALSRVLSKAPADRFSPAAQFAEALSGTQTAPRPVETQPAPAPTAVREKSRRNVIAYAAIAILAIIGAVTVISRTVGPAGSATAAEIPKLAVLPFDNLGSAEDDYFADGITGEISSRIAEISGLRVISRQSANQYEGSDKTLQQIGEELGVEYVLMGTIRTDRIPDGSGQVRVTPELIRVSDDAQIWTTRYTASLVPGEIFGVQEQIANQVAEALNVTLLEPERQRLAAKPTDNEEAYDYYLRGNAYYAARFVERSVRLATDMYERAVELDPNFSEAYARLAIARTWLSWQFSRIDENPRVQEAIDRAVALAPNTAEVRISLGGYFYRVVGDYDKALEEFRAVRARYPNHARAIFLVGSIHRRRGEWDRAIQAFVEAFELNPRDFNVVYAIGQTYAALRRYGEAESYLDSAISLAPDQPRGYITKASLYVHWDKVTDRAWQVLRDAAGRVDRLALRATEFWFSVLDRDFDQALEAVSSLREDPDYYLLSAHLHRLTNDRRLEMAYADSARAQYETSAAELPPDGSSPFARANLHSVLGAAYAHLARNEDAIREGERAVEPYPTSLDAFAGPQLAHRLAEILVLVGEYDAAFEQLETFLSAPSRIYQNPVELDPIWDPLRDDPRFQALLAKYEN